MAKDKDSLDFTRPPPKRPRRPAAAPQRRTTAARTPRDAPRSGRLVLIILIVIAFAFIGFLMSREEVSRQSPAPSRTAKKSAPVPEAPPAAPKAAQPYPPPTKLQTPEQSAPKALQIGAIPPDFLKIVQTYNTKAGFKAVALALDADGKWAYGMMTGAGAQTAANDEALAECAKFKVQSGAKADCKLFAVGDKVIW